jgi:tetratricopeptide (TPR) repeat protein
VIGYAEAHLAREHDTTRTDLERAGSPALAGGALAPGTRIGRYVVAQRLGEGGMGVVYAARDTELARDVALKLVRPLGNAAAMQARLRREAMAMARLSHRYVVPVFDIGSHDDRLFIAMELVAGESLRAWVARPRSWRAVAQLFAQAGLGLAAAHAAGLLHRDFKPDNVVVDDHGAPRITDFGLARERGDDGPSPCAVSADPGRALALVTATGNLAGTPAYMAPEQLLGEPAGPAADQFSFCVSLFEVLYGVRPFPPADPPEALVAAIRAGRVVAPAAPRTAPRWLHAAIARGLAFDPAQRWPSMVTLVEALERGLRRRRLRAVGIAAVVGLGLALGVGWRARNAVPDCLEVARKGNDAATILVCSDDYARAGDPTTGAQLADALRRTGKLREAATVATELLATPARADALQTLGKIAVREDRRDDAERALRLASELHRGQGQRGEAAADLLALAELSTDFVDQLLDLEQAVRDARLGRAPKIEAYCHLAAARVLSEIGARDGALGALARAEPLIGTPSDRVGFDLESGNVHQNLGDHALAVLAFDRARAGAQAATIARRALSARLNAVYSLAEAGRPDAAALELEAARALDPGDRKLTVRLALEARIASRRGDPARAAELVDRALAATEPSEREDLLELEIQRAEIAIQNGELAAGEQWARRAIAHVEALRSPHPPVELRSWMVTDRRRPYELLFASLAGRGDAAGALVVFDRYRGLGVLAALATGGGSGGPPSPAPAFPAAELARLLPLAGASALATPAPERAIVDAVRAASVLALVVANDALWRITAAAGQLAVARLGELAELRTALDRFRAAPGDRAAAAVIGELLVPAELARPSDGILHVVLDEPLAGLPIAALWVGERRLGAARPIALLARPSDVACATIPAGARRAVSLAAPGDHAGPPGSDQRDATRASLLERAPGELRYLAARLERDALGEILVLGDGRVRLLELAGQPRGAAQLVAIPPGTRATGTTGLAMALLAAGTAQVIAPIRPVSRAAIDRLVAGLDGADTSDLARALARLQRGADGDDEQLGFASFGRATCIPQH